MAAANPLYMGIALAMATTCCTRRLPPHHFGRRRTAQGLNAKVSSRVAESCHFRFNVAKLSLGLGSGVRSLNGLSCRAGSGGALRWGSDFLRRTNEDDEEEDGASEGEDGDSDSDDDEEDLYDSVPYDPEDEIVGFYEDDRDELDDGAPDLEAEQLPTFSKEEPSQRESTSALIAQYCERIRAQDEEAVLRTEDIAGLYGFPLDRFQRMAIDGFLKGSSVVVCAPTSSGKTLIAEAAAVATLARGKRLFYTTPLKALSNQKLREFRKLFGEENVGLLTGDAAVNRDAPVLVMTTEILRNMLYQSAGNADDEGGRLENVCAVVLDEVHYLSDISRGTVWEETVIYCPKSVQLVCLSATVANPEELAGWIAQVHGPTELVTSSKRPVPLMWHFSTKYVLEPLLNEQGNGMNPRLSLADSRLNSNSSSSNFWDEDSSSRGRKGSEGRRRFGRGSENGSGRRKGDGYGNGRGELSEEVVAMLRRRQVPQVRDTLRQLVARDMLPAIWFIFSRRGCDTAVKYLAEASLLTEDEFLKVKEAMTEFKKQHPEAIRETAVDPLLRGVAAHHAGCLPLWKAFVEELFQKGLVKVVFATETLSAGINMPARTTVLSSLSKRGDNGHVLLSSNAMLQMAGRAGRRGIDEQGHVVVVQTPFEGAEDSCKLLFAGSDPIVSQFTATYGMALNLLAGGKVQKRVPGSEPQEERKAITFGRTLNEARELIEKSFGNYVGSEVMVAAKQQLSKIEQEVERLVQKTQSVDVAQALESRVTKNEMQTYLSFKEAVKERKAGLLKIRRDLEKLRVSTYEPLLSDVGSTYVPHISIAYFDPRTGSECLITALSVCNVPKPPFISFRRPETGEAEQDSEEQQEEEEEAEEAEDLAYNVALGPDNRWYLFTAKSVKGFARAGPDLELPDQTTRDTLKGKVKFSSKFWQLLGKSGTDASSSVWVADSSPETRTWSSQVPIFTDHEVPEVLQPVEEVISHERKQISLLRKRLKMTIAYKENQQLVVLQRSRLEKIARLKQKAGRIVTRISQMAPSGWTEFLQVVEVLNAADAIKLASTELLSLGQTASAVRGENELWLAKIFSSDHVRSLSSPQLAAVCGTLVSDGIKTRPEYGHSVMYEASSAVQAWVDAMEGERVRLLDLQKEHGVSIQCLIDVQFAGMLEAWASGVTWKELMMDCGMDEGDVARLLRRSIDLLAQIPHLPHVDPGVAKLARQATYVMDRPPISELIS